MLNVALLEPFQGERQVSPTLAGKDLLPNQDNCEGLGVRQFWSYSG